MLQHSINNKVSYAGVALIFFYAYDLFYMIMQKVTSNEFIAKASTLLILYMILAVAFLKSPKIKYLWGISVIFFCAVIFMVSYLIHPEYENAMFYMPSWNIWNSVFTFSSGIFACLFFQMFDDANTLRRYLKYAGYLILIWCIFRISSAIAKGGFYRTMENGSVSMNTYDMLLGYRLLFVSIIFGVEFQKESKNVRFIYIGISIVTFILMIIYGSRTATVSFIVFWILKSVFCKGKEKSNKRIFKIVFMLILSLLIYIILTNEVILTYFKNILENIGINSRILDSMIEGSITLDKGRESIWINAWKMILENPIIGNGVYADRYIFGIYCHQIILEVLLNFGVFAGTLIILFLIWNSCNILLKCKNSEWKLLFILFLSMVIIRLNVSSSFWNDTNFWACLIIGSKALKETPKIKIVI